MNRHLYRENIQVVNEHKKDTTLSIRKIQIKIRIYHVIPIKMAIIKKIQIIGWAGEDVEQLETSCSADGNVK